MNWTEIVDRINREHNGVFGIRLFFGHDGHHACCFDSYTETLAEGDSGRSMQEAVERCVESWNLDRQARSFAKEPILNASTEQEER